MSGWTFWIDRGGTFTDVVARDPSGRVLVKKLLSENPERYVDAPLEAIRQFLGADEGSLVGLFTERDVLNKVALEYEEVKDLPISELMTPNPIYVYTTDSSAAALSVMAATGYRHVPVVDLDEKLVGIIGPLRVTSFLQDRYNEFAV